MANDKPINPSLQIAYSQIKKMYKPKNTYEKGNCEINTLKRCCKKAKTRENGISHLLRENATLHTESVTGTRNFHKITVR